MSALRQWRERLIEFVRGRRVDSEVRDEVESHIELLTDDNIRRGMAPDDARRAARRAMGSVEATKEAMRDARGLRPLETFGQDVRYAVRLLRKSPGFACVAILTLALGIGVNTAIFSLVDAVMLRPLPYPDADRLISIVEFNIGDGPETNSSSGTPVATEANRNAIAPANIADYARASSLERIASFASEGFNVTGNGTPERINGERVSWTYFDVLKSRPLSGRTLLASDDREGAAPVALISERLWRRRFNADPAITARTINLDGTAHTVIGVMPDAFRGVMTFATAVDVDLWVPAAYPADLLANRGDHEVNLIGRLAPGATAETAQTELSAISTSLATQFPQTNGKQRTMARPLIDDLVRGVRTSLVLMVSMVALVLLIACANVANLLLVRGVARRRELAVRVALGAQRGRVIRELLTQSLVLALAACAVGLFLGALTKDVLVAMAPRAIPRLHDVSLDGRVLAVTVVVTVLTGLIFGLLPAWQGGRTRPIDVLRATGRTVAGTGVMRWRHGLMITEIALSMILLIGAALTVRSLVAMDRVPLGFSTSHVVAVNVTLPQSRYPDGDARQAFFTALAERVRAVPGVASVAYANRLPLRGGWSGGFGIIGLTQPNAPLEADFQAISPGYFDVLSIPLKQGRLFVDSDTKTSEPVAVVSEQFARAFLKGQNPIGQLIARGPKAPQIKIVGVVGDVRRGGKLAELNPQVYLAAAQTQIYPVQIADLAVKAQGDPLALRATLERIVADLDPNQPISTVRTLDDILLQRGEERRFQAMLFSLFALLAIVLALIGVYGVVSFSVSQRTPEIGVRTALGAGRWQIFRWLLGDTATRVGVGAVIGTAAAAALSSFVKSLLFQVEPTDVATYATSAVALCVVALGAAALAARRATSIDPVRALRGD